MKVKELIKLLQGLPDEHQELPVFVHDGMGPSDPQEATEIKVGAAWWTRDLPVIQIKS